MTSMRRCPPFVLATLALVFTLGSTSPARATVNVTGVVTEAGLPVSASFMLARLVSGCPCYSELGDATTSLSGNYSMLLNNSCGAKCTTGVPVQCALWVSADVERRSGGSAFVITKYVNVLVDASGNGSAVVNFEINNSSSFGAPALPNWGPLALILGLAVLGFTSLRRASLPGAGLRGGLHVLIGIVGLAAALALPSPAFAAQPLAQNELTLFVGARCPHCSGCDPVSATFLECLHRGRRDPCDSTRCIENIMVSATCALLGTNGDDACTVKETKPKTWEVRQIGRTHSCSSNVDWHVWMTLYQGNPDCPATSWRVRCDTNVCTGDPFEDDSFRYPRRECK
jgi:hypothetical protein